jgi:NAD(P)-dependent dehydrogenase (short-subunit alcohol dehydrogenase family)
MPVYPELAGRVVLVTGGANGIGASIVRAFVAARARVHFCDVDLKAGRALAKELRNAVVFSRVDLTRERDIRSWVTEVLAQNTQISVLINNAACDPRIPLAKTSAKDWDDLFSRNLRACFLTAREVSGSMPAGSAIVNFASITFHIAPAEMTAYVATKGGILGLTRALARELGPRRIRVNAISPGWIMTERQLRQYVTPAVKRLIRRSQSIPDLIQPREIAEIALFLASDGSSAITGQEILADRGWQFS